MPTLRITGTRRGFEKIAHTHYLREALGLGLRDAKAATDDVLEGTPFEFEVARSALRGHCEALESLGAVVDCPPSVVSGTRARALEVTRPVVPRLLLKGSR